MAQRFLLGGNLLRKDVPKGDPEMDIDAQWWRRRDSNPRPSDYDSLSPYFYPHSPLLTNPYKTSIQSTLTPQRHLFESLLFDQN